MEIASPNVSVLEQVDNPHQRLPGEALPLEVSGSHSEKVFRSRKQDDHGRVARDLARLFR